jgi:hypothetical protein
MSEIIKILKIPVLFGLLTAALSLGIGAVINTYVPWEWLTSLFVIFRSLLNLFSFTLDLDTLSTIIGYSLKIIVSAWALIGTLIIIRYFHK